MSVVHLAAAVNTTVSLWKHQFGILVTMFGEMSDETGNSEDERQKEHLPDQLLSSIEGNK